MFELVLHNSFEKDRTKEYKLSIQISLNGFSFSMVAPNLNKLLAFKQTALQISNAKLIPRRFVEWLNEEQLFRLTFAEVEIIIENQNFALIPQFLSEKERNNILAQNLFTAETEFAVKKRIIENSDFELLFTLPKQLEEICLETFYKVEFNHVMGKLLENLPPIEQENGILILTFSEVIYLVIFKQNKIELANSYKVLHNNDIVYFVLSAANLNQIQPKTTEVFLVENYKTWENLKEELSTYFFSVSNKTNSPSIQIDADQFSIQTENLLGLI